jgi:hypothetical protein
MNILREASKKMSYNKESKMNNKKDTDPVVWLEKKYPTMTNEFKRIQGEQYKLFCRKQYDYGPMNIAMGTDLSKMEDIKLSITALVVRINDKITRLINLVIKNDREGINESVDDSFVDLSVYGVIAQIVRNKKWAK